MKSDDCVPLLPRKRPRRNAACQPQSGIPRFHRVGLNFSRLYIPLSRRRGWPGGGYLARTIHQVFFCLRGERGGQFESRRRRDASKSPSRATAREDGEGRSPLKPQLNHPTNRCTRSAGSRIEPRPGSIPCQELVTIPREPAVPRAFRRE